MSRKKEKGHKKKDIRKESYNEIDKDLKRDFYKEKHSEFYYFTNFLSSFIMLPFLIIGLFLGLHDMKYIFKKFDYIKYYFKDAKYTTFLIIILILMFFISIFISYQNPELFEQNFVHHSNDLFSSNWYTIFTSIFVHASTGHLLSNLFALLIFGRIVEKKLNSKVILVFLMSGVGANILRSLTVSTQIGGVGASGGVAGIIAVSMLAEPMRVTFYSLIPMTTMIFGSMWFFQEYLAMKNATGNIAHNVHLFGFLIGTGTGFMFVKNAFHNLIMGLIGNVALFGVIYYLFTTLGI